MELKPAKYIHNDTPPIRLKDSREMYLIFNKKQITYELNNSSYKRYPLYA